MQGHPSNSMAEAGVFISQIDVMHHPTKPWLPCPLDDRTVWCWWLGDRIPGSVISRQQVDLARERKCMRAARTRDAATQAIELKTSEAAQRARYTRGPATL